MKKTFLYLGLSLLPASGLWADLMPSFATVPTGWTTDRYAPASFSNVGTYQGRADVLGIGISTADGAANRPNGQQGAFYNTQGMKYAIAGGAGSSISADLYIAADWSDGSNGNRRSDMWGVISDPTISGGDQHQYPIIGFTNYGGTARYRVWDEDTANGWVDLATNVVYDSWTSFSIVFTGTSYEFYINGLNVYTDSTVGGATGFDAVIMQAYNFNDASIGGAVGGNYTAYWSNTAAVPEPGSILLLSTMAGLIGWARRRSFRQN